MRLDARRVAEAGHVAHEEDGERGGQRRVAEHELLERREEEQVLEAGSLMLRVLLGGHNRTPERVVLQRRAGHQRRREEQLAHIIDREAAVAERVESGRVEVRKPKICIADESIARGELQVL